MLSLILAIIISIADGDVRHYITRDEVRAVIASHADTTAIRPADCQPIEDALTATHMIRTAECYIRSNGTLMVTVTQRQPICLVRTGTRTYWIDSDRQIVAIKPGIDVSVPSVSGAISDPLATSGVYDLMTCLSRDDFYREQMREVLIADDEQATILLQDGRKVLLGPIDDGFRRRLRKLVRLYRSGYAEWGNPNKKIFDLRYRGQVITR